MNVNFQDIGHSPLENEQNIGITPPRTNLAQARQQPTICENYLGLKDGQRDNLIKILSNDRKGTSAADEIGIARGQGELSVNRTLITNKDELPTQFGYFHNNSEDELFEDGSVEDVYRDFDHNAKLVKFNEKNFLDLKVGKSNIESYRDFENQAQGLASSQFILSDQDLYMNLKDGKQMISAKDLRFINKDIKEAQKLQQEYSSSFSGNVSNLNLVASTKTRIQKVKSGIFQGSQINELISSLGNNYQLDIIEEQNIQQKQHRIQSRQRILAQNEEFEQMSSEEDWFEGDSDQKSHDESLIQDETNMTPCAFLKVQNPEVQLELPNDPVALQLQPIDSFSTIHEQSHESSSWLSRGRTVKTQQEYLQINCGIPEVGKIDVLQNNNQNIINLDNMERPAQEEHVNKMQTLNLPDLQNSTPKLSLSGRSRINSQSKQGSNSNSRKRDIKTFKFEKEPTKSRKSSKNSQIGPLRERSNTEEFAFNLTIEPKVQKPVDQTSDKNVFDFGRRHFEMIMIGETVKLNRSKSQSNEDNKEDSNEGALCNNSSSGQRSFSLAKQDKKKLSKLSQMEDYGSSQEDKEYRKQILALGNNRAPFGEISELSDAELPISQNLDQEPKQEFQITAEHSLLANILKSSLVGQSTVMPGQASQTAEQAYNVQKQQSVTQWEMEQQQQQVVKQYHALYFDKYSLAQIQSQVSEAANQANQKSEADKLKRSSNIKQDSNQIKINQSRTMKTKILEDTSHGVQEERKVQDTAEDLLESVTIEELGKMTNECDANLLPKAGAPTHYNIMVCGAAGVGKSSFIELFIDKFHFEKEVSANESLKESTIVTDLHKDVIKKQTDTFCESEVDSGNFTLRVVDSAGYGNKSDISEWRESITTEILLRMKTYKSACDDIEGLYKGDDQKISREKKKVDDKRIHVMLYFFDGHHTKEQDFLSVKDFQEHTNVIPILAKGDQFTPDELKDVKKNLVEQARASGVSFFDVQSVINDISNDKVRNKILADCINDHELAPCPPFVIINPTQRKLTKKTAKKFTQQVGRNYPWGFADAMDDKNSDFARLHKLVLKHLRHELRSTMEQKYKNFEENIRNQEELMKQQQSADCNQQMAKIGTVSVLAAICGATIWRIAVMKE